MEKTRLLCQWKSLLYFLLLCKSVFYYSELFVQWSLSCVSKRFCCSSSQWIIHCFEILRLCTVRAGSPARFQGADLFSSIQIKIRWIFFHVSFQFWLSLILRFLFIISLSISLTGASSSTVVHWRYYVSVLRVILCWVWLCLPPACKGQTRKPSHEQHV